MEKRGELSYTDNGLTANGEIEHFQIAARADGSLVIQSIDNPSRQWIGQNNPTKYGKVWTISITGANSLFGPLSGSSVNLVAIPSKSTRASTGPGCRNTGSSTAR